MRSLEVGVDAFAPYVPRILMRQLAHAPDQPAWTLEGSVVFVDISGFTKLSEKLARKGKEGAEQVTEAIESCFTELLAVAYANGGSLLKFGGDALLLFFSGEGHAARAGASAVGMRTHPAHGRQDQPAARQDPAAHVGGRAQRLVRLLPRRGFSPRADRGRPGVDAARC